MEAVGPPPGARLCLPGQSQPDSGSLMNRARKGVTRVFQLHEAHPGLTLGYSPCFALKTFIFPKLELAFHKLSSSALAGL